MLKICKYKNGVKVNSSLDGKTSQNNANNDSPRPMFDDIFVDVVCVISGVVLPAVCLQNYLNSI